MIRHASGHLQVILVDSIQEPGAFAIEGKVDPIAEIEQTHQPPFTSMYSAKPRFLRPSRQKQIPGNKTLATRQGNLS